MSPDGRFLAWLPGQNQAFPAAGEREILLWAVVVAVFVIVSSDGGWSETEMS
jgi:hypothetical protein